MTTMFGHKSRGILFAPFCDLHIHVLACCIVSFLLFWWFLPFGDEEYARLSFLFLYVLNCPWSLPFFHGISFLLITKTLWNICNKSQEQKQHVWSKNDEFLISSSTFAVFHFRDATNIKKKKKKFWKTLKKGFCYCTKCFQVKLCISPCDQGCHY